MFIPIEYAYFAALKADKDLNAYAKSKKVALEELGVNHKKTLTPYLENNP